jgi:hypothetical protein
MSFEVRSRWELNARRLDSERVVGDIVGVRGTRSVVTSSFTGE